jgi:hypothetical protein
MVQISQAVGPDVYRSILVNSHAEKRAFFPALAEALKEEHGSKIALNCSTKQEEEYYTRNYPGLFDAAYSFRFYNRLLENVESHGDYKSLASAYERKYDFLFTHLFADDRHIGLGFSPGGLNFPRSIFSRNASYWKSIRAFVLLIQFFEKIIDENRISLVINPSKPLAIVARGRGIPVRTLTETRYKGFMYWAVNDVLESNLVMSAFEKLKDVSCDVRLDSQPAYYLETRALALESFRLKKALYDMGYQVLRRIYQHLRGYEKRKGYLLKDNVRAHYRVWSQYRKARRHSAVGLEELRGTDYIYFPLGVEPERSLTRDSPEFSHQAYAIQALAKDLPSGVFLAVKEHLTAIGPRSDGFYESLSMLTNVRMVDLMTPSLELIRSAKAVATVTGTAGLEAAIMGVPVISFGKHNIYNIVPHVHYISSWLELLPAVREILSTFDSGREKRSADGARFLQALIDISVDFGTTNFNESIPPEILEETIRLLDTVLRVA